MYICHILQGIFTCNIFTSAHVLVLHYVSFDLKELVNSHNLSQGKGLKHIKGVLSVAILKYDERACYTQCHHLKNVTLFWTPHVQYGMGFDYINYTLHLEPMYHTIIRFWVICILCTKLFCNFEMISQESAVDTCYIYHNIEKLSKALRWNKTYQSYFI